MVKQKSLNLNLLLVGNQGHPPASFCKKDLYGVAMNKRFSYGKFAYQVLVQSKEPCTPGGMAREAMMHGAPHTQDKLIKQLRSACESLASRADIKRIRNKETKGYLYQFIG